MKAETTEDPLTSKQEARAKLRESFLKAVNNLHGECCTILTYEQSNLTGTFSSWKPDGSEVLIRDLKTPANIVMTSALLRTPDILALQFDKSCWHLDSLGLNLACYCWLDLLDSPVQTQLNICNIREAVGIVLTIEQLIKSVNKQPSEWGGD